MTLEENLAAAAGEIGWHSLERAEQDVYRRMADYVNEVYLDEPAIHEGCAPAGTAAEFQRKGFDSCRARAAAGLRRSAEGRPEIVAAALLAAATKIEEMTP